jgi:hypothetical protein
MLFSCLSNRTTALPYFLETALFGPIIRNCSMRSRIFALLTFLLLAGGCTTTPDMSEWAKASQDLKTSVTASQYVMLETVNQTVSDLKVGKAEGWDNLDADIKTWAGNQEVFAHNVAKIETSLGIMVAYANELAALAKASEGGKEASDSLFESMNSVLGTIGAPFTGSQAALAGSKAIIDKVSEIVTLVQGQENLLDAMATMQAAVDFMQSEIESSSKAIRGLVSTSTTTQLKIVRLKFGTNKERYLRNKFNLSYTKIEKMYGDAIKEENAVKLTAELNAELGVKERLRAEYLQFLKDKDAVLVWREYAKTNLRGIITASRAWSQAHEDAKELLKVCGGLRSLRKECGHLTVPNLKASIDWVKSTATIFRGGSEEPAENGDTE